MGVKAAIFSWSPPAKINSVPSSAGFLVPETGASMKATPRGSNSSAKSLV